jgi:hypothetical protein
MRKAAGTALFISRRITIPKDGVSGKLLQPQQEAIGASMNYLESRNDVHVTGR